MNKKACYFFICLFFINQDLLVAQSLSFITEEIHPCYGCVQLADLSEKRLSKLKKEDLKVFLFPHSPESQAAAIIGNWTKEDDKVYFRPLIPFTKSLTYQARFPGLPYFTFKAIPKKEYSLTKIVDIFPNAAILPENNLKVYLYFSAPMSDNQTYEFLRLEDEKGKVVNPPFLELKPLLWNEDRTRLTLWFDPGRVKRDLIKNKKLGAPLIEGHSYTLYISKNWKDANGYSLAKDYERAIEVGKADRSSPNPKNWMATEPTINTKEPILLHFGESLDHALALNSFTIFTKKGKRVAGKIHLQNEDKDWVFTPLNNWKTDKYRIQIKAELEDLAGNNLNRLFDTDLEKTSSPNRDLRYYYFDFFVR